MAGETFTTSTQVPAAGFTRAQLEAWGENLLPLTPVVDGTKLVIAANQITIGAIPEGDVTGLTAALAAKQGLDATLTALAALDSTGGCLAQIGADTFAKRTISAASSAVTVADGDGVAGNPSIDLIAFLKTLGAGSQGAAVADLTSANDPGDGTIAALTFHATVYTPSESEALRDECEKLRDWCNELEDKVNELTASVRTSAAIAT